MANDLYSGLIQPYLRKGQNGEQFWGLYDKLDLVKVPQPSDFLKIQIQGLKNLEKGKKYEATNAFLKRVDSELANHENTAEENLGEEVYGRIMELMNSGLKGSDINPFKVGKGLNKTQQQEKATENINAILSELKMLLQQTKTNEGLSNQIVDMLERRFKNFNWNTTPHDYIMEKANLTEALMVDKMNQNPALRAIVTGAWTDMSGQQLIEDAFAFNKGEISIPFQYGSLKYSIKINGKTKTRSAISILDFLDQLNNLNKQNFSVKLSDELYEALKVGSAIAGQAKSGRHGQAILNINKRNSISLGEAGFDPMMLWDLYQADLATRTEFFKPESQQHSEDLEALSNYCLSKSIAKTALAANQLYLTSEGFVSASQWMSLNERYLIFSPAVNSISGDFLTKSRPYAFIN